MLPPDILLPVIFPLIHIHSESDYAIGLAHGMLLTGFLSDLKLITTENIVD